MDDIAGNDREADVEFLVMLVAFVVVDVLAMRYGVDSRPLDK